MIFYGWRKTSKKILKKLKGEKCPICGNETFAVLRIKTWVTVFFISIIPYKTRKYLVCEKCSNGFEITKEEAKELL